MVNQLLSSVVNIGSLNVALVDLILLGLLLISIIVGVIRGFLGQILSVLGSLAAIILAVILCDEIADFITKSMPGLHDGLKDKISELFGLTEELLAGSKEQIINALSQTNIPAFLHEILANAIIESAGALDIANTLTRWALVAISFVIIFIIANLLFLIIKKIFKSLTKIKVIGALDRLLGAILMALKLLVVSMLILTILSIFTDMNSVLAPTLDDGTVVNSVTNSILSWIMQLDFIQNLFIA